ncbi:hypothetical protein KVP06_12410 [Geobacter sulfurreducens]|uniref:Uncharacterized protein n=1 Tax=Geobacter sulfurreducens (strain ATCC 51573 / DSM 12127 / PCA) TaxID=243231 RepID=Q74AC1_GEOSL|nr:hypothetical protein [Geobacter sulfurreducens]AAR35842.1 hypothetical protein GSU2469 [Geobacter sulfurreducens PCA]UAC03172.1 hypothetical protein KVP06_12410 [Geobacter sulfurreducens]HBB70827.1 hypothetical protein [Geobacter sulfurreducens]HCD97375.1 hypothetical protein [Geobacter sulfurreducens]
MKDRDYTAPGIVMGVIFYITILSSAAPTLKMIDIVAPIATLLAALVGAEAAFRLQREKTEKTEMTRRKSAANQTVHLISNIYSNLRQYRREIIEPTETLPVPWLGLRGLLAYHYEVNLPREGLLFMFEGEGDGAQIYAELIMEEQRYNLAIGMIKQLHETIKNKLQPELERLGYYPGNVDIQQLLSQLPPSLIIDLNSLTHETYKIVRENIESIQEVYEKFQQSMKSQFPNIKVARLIFDDGMPNQAETPA